MRTASFCKLSLEVITFLPKALFLRSFHTISSGFNLGEYGGR